MPAHRTFYQCSVLGRELRVRSAVTTANSIARNQSANGPMKTLPIEIDAIRRALPDPAESVGALLRCDRDSL